MFPALLILLFVGGVFIRAAFLLETQEYPEFQIPMEYQQDMGFNDNTAMALAQYMREKFGLPSIEKQFDRTIVWTQRGNEYLYRPPAYTVFLAALYFVLGDNQLGIRIAQMFLGLGSACLGYILGRQMYGRLAGIVLFAGMLYYWPLIIYENALHSPVMVIFTGLLFLVSAFHWAKRRGLLQAAMMGAALAVYTLSVTALLPLIPLIVLWMLVMTAWPFWNRRFPCGTFHAILVMLLCFSIPVGAVTCYNYYASGRLVLISGIAGMTLYIGNQPESEGYLLGCDAILDEFLEEEEHSLTTDEKAARVPWPEVSERAYNVAMNYIIAHPAWFVKLSAKRAILFWTPKEISQNITEYCDRLFSRTLYCVPGNFTLVFGLASMGILYFLRGLGSALLRKTGEDALSSHYVPCFILISLLTAILYVPYVLLWVSAHFRAPILPCLFAFAALGIGESIRFLRLKRWRSLCLGIAGPVLVLPVMLLAPVNYDKDIERWVYFRTRHYLEQGQQGKAAEIARRVVERAPEHAFARMTYANILLNLDKRKEALAQYERAYFYDGESVDRKALAEIIGILRREFGDLAGAADIFRELVKLDPKSYLALHGLGHIAFEKGSYDEALSLLEQARAIDPGKGNTYFLMGLALEKSGQREKAMAILTEGISVDPRDPWIMLALADLKRETGAVEEACSLYQKALNLDSANVKAQESVSAYCSQRPTSAEPLPR